MVVDRNSGPPDLLVKSWKSTTISPGPVMANIPSSCKVQHAMDSICNARDRVIDEIRDDVHLDNSNMGFFYHEGVPFASFWCWKSRKSSSFVLAYWRGYSILTKLNDSQDTKWGSVIWGWPLASQAIVSSTSHLLTRVSCGECKGSVSSVNE